MKFRRLLIPLLALLLLLVGLLMNFIGTDQAHASTAPPGVTIGSHPLGLNINPSDIVAANPALWARIAAAEKQLPPLNDRFGHGTKADTYNWEAYNSNGIPGRDTYKCAIAGHQSADFYGPCSKGDALSFAMWAAEASQIGATGTVTVNYGTGTPALAGAWAKYIRQHASPVTDIEIGNENYGCSSADIPITKPPVSDASYEPHDPAHCPYAQYGGGPEGTAKFAQSFIAHGPAYISAVHAADPGAKILLDYALGGPGRSSAPVWDHTVMPAVSGWDGLSVLWYPFGNGDAGAGLADKDMLPLPTQIPSRAALIKADLRAYPGKFYDISEFNANNGAMTAICHPAGGVFTGASALAWLVQGARTVQYWTQADTNNSSGCTRPEFGMFNAQGHATPPFYGFKLAGMLARPGARLSAYETGNPKVLAYRATGLPGGHTAVFYANLNTGGRARVTGPNVGSPAVLTRYNGKLTVAHVKPGKTITLPGDTLTVVER